MSSVDVDLGWLVDDADPNAPTSNQATLKRLETAIRRHCDSELMLMLDRISLLEDPALVKSEMLKLKRILEGKAGGK